MSNESPLLFEPDRTYSNKEIAKTIGITPRTLKRWRKEKKFIAAVSVSNRIHRTPGDVLNAWWQSLPRVVR